MLKAVHRQVLEVVAFILNVNAELLEEGVLDKDEYINAFDSFFAKDGKRAILIYFQPMEPPPFGTANQISITYNFSYRNFT